MSVTIKLKKPLAGSGLRNCLNSSDLEYSVSDTPGSSVSWVGVQVDPESPPVVDLRAEKAFLMRLDVCLMVYFWISYCIKQIDSSNYKTAYVSGMKEELDLNGNELNYFDTCFRIGYALCVIPSQIIMIKIRPSLYLPALELIWGILTGLIAVAQDAKLIYAMRFLIGACEASSYPGIVTVLMLWYNPSELSKRVAIFGTSYPAANIFIGSMQAALHSGMDGVCGLSGWRWLFIINALMTVTVALAGFYFIPDSPQDSRAWWLNAEFRKIARRRMEDAGRKGPVGLTIAKVGKSFSTWPLWAFTTAYGTWSWSQNSNMWYSLFLKSVMTDEGLPRFSVAEVNLIPIGAYVLQMASMLTFAYLSNKTGKRGQWCLIQLITVVAGCIILSIWPPSFGVKMLGFHLLFLSHAVGSILIAWLAEICANDAEQRALTIGVSVTFVYVVDSVANIFIYPASQAPKYPVGYKVAIAFAVMSFLSIIFMKRMWNRDRGVAARKVPPPSFGLMDLKSIRSYKI